ncbi:hypothetical protein [Paracoccus sanguinis]|uniref:hypothetical protein n=1 Tax=Paracoccus sanguinis TaxID=1545044 RepID=UPI000690EDE2|nr:hypothetical protein [Paracoccus sanguinis]
MERSEARIRDSAAPAQQTDRGYVDWGSILAGAVVAAGLSAVFTAFGAGVGLGSISAREGQGLGFGSVILTGLFMVITIVASYMAGGYVAGRMRRRVDGANAEESATRDGMHGLVVWGLGMLLSAMVLGNVVSGTVKAAGSAAGTAVEAAGSVAGGLAQGAGQLVGGVAQGAGQAAQGAADAAQNGGIDLPNPLDGITDRLLRSEAQAPAEFSNEAIRSEVATIFADVIRTGEINPEDRAYLERAVAARTQLSQQEVSARIDQGVARAQELRAEAQKLRDDAAARVEELRVQAVETAEDARRAGVLSAFALAASALVAAVAAFIGGQKGGLHRDEGRVWAGFTHKPLRRR